MLLANVKHDNRALNLFAWARVRLEIKMSEIGMFMSETCKGDTFS